MSGSASIALSLLGGSAGTTGISLSFLTSSATDPVAAMRRALRDETKAVALEAQQPDVKRDIDNFTSAVNGATSAQDLLKNPTVLKVLLTANGLGDQAGYTALAQKALLSDPSDASSLVNKLSNTSWKSAAQTYQFATKGLSVIQNSSVMSTITNAYAEVKWRQSLDAATPGLSNALTFRSEASGITSVDQILGDSVLRDVVTTALGIPKQIAYQPLEAQEKAISNRLDITKFQDASFVDRFTQRYLVAKQQSTTTTSTTSSLDSLATQARSLIV